MKILIIGDSFVEGVGATNKEGWAQKVKEYFKQHEFKIVGFGGDNIEKINNRLKNLSSTDFNIVILEVGLNDSRYRPSKQANEIPKEDFYRGLQKFQNFFNDGEKDGVKIIIIGLTKVDEKLACPSKEDKYYINGNIKVYNSYLQDFANQNNLQFIEVPSLLDGNYLFDGLHPNDKGHISLFESIKDKII